MQTPEPTKVGGIRLTPSYWGKFRAVWRHRGRKWFEALIDREHKKIPTGEKQ